MHKHLLMLLVCLIQINISAQVTIGSVKEPKSFSTLEVNSSSGGIRYPQMSVATRNSMSANSNSASGLMIFNTDISSLEYFANGEWRDLTTETNGGSTGNLATIESNGKESTASTTSYKFFIKFPAATAASNLRVGKKLDKFNVATTVEGSVNGTLSQTSYPIKVTLSKERVNAQAGMDSQISCYAIYQEKGIDRRVEFIIDMTTRSLSLVAKK